MNERQLIMIRALVEQVEENSTFNAELGHFEQSAPLSIKIEPSEYKELAKIKIYIDDVLEDIQNLVIETDS